MNGPQHYEAAERLLRSAHELALIEGADPEVRDRAVMATVAEAQVHATLALAAATALGLSDRDGMRMGDGEAWEAACSVVAPAGDS